MSSNMKCVQGSPLPLSADGLPCTYVKSWCPKYVMETLGFRWVILRENAIVFGIIAAQERRVKDEVLIKYDVGDI